MRVGVVKEKECFDGSEKGRFQIMVSHYWVQFSSKQTILFSKPYLPV